MTIFVRKWFGTIDTLNQLVMTKLGKLSFQLLLLRTTNNHAAFNNNKNNQVCSIKIIRSHGDGIVF